MKAAPTSRVFDIQVNPTRRLFEIGKRLTAAQQLFVEEYLIDLDERRAGSAVGWGGVRAKKALEHPYIREAIEIAMAQRSERLRVDQDKVVSELAKMGFANMADYMDAAGRPVLDVRALSRDHKAAIKRVRYHEELPMAGRPGHRRVELELHDKHAALVSLGRHLGMFVDRSEVAHSFEARVASMTREERLARMRELLAPMAEYLHELDLESEEFKEVSEGEGGEDNGVDGC